MAVPYVIRRGCACGDRTGTRAVARAGPVVKTQHHSPSSRPERGGRLALARVFGGWEERGET